MRAGIREVIGIPSDRKLVAEALGRAQDNLQRRPVVPESTDLIYSFLPAKGGVGASTLAVNCALGIAKHERVLLVDFDLNNGIVKSLLKVDSPYSVIDAAMRASALDERSWAEMVCNRSKLDVLHTGEPSSDIRMEQLQLRDLVDYARRNYKAICFDLSGNLEEYSIELMHHSRRVFLVCTTELCSLYLARERMLYLKRFGLADRVSILLNRYHTRNVMGQRQVEELVGAPIMMTFTNDYFRVNKSIAAGAAVDPASELGQQYSALSSYMLGKKEQAPAAARRRFIDNFRPNLAPAGI
jgi:pilus assembly protein CpaE